MLDNRNEEYDLMTGDTNLLATIRTKHMQLISRTWIVASIIVQTLILVMAVGVFWQATLYHFYDNSGNLTVLFFWVNTGEHDISDFSFEHSGTKYWWFYFGDKGDCEIASVNTEATCKILENIRYSNSLLVAGLIVAYVFTLLSTLFLVMMFCQKYYRITNIVLLVPALCFLCSPLIWYFTSEARNDLTEVRWSPLITLEVFGILELICFLGGRYYANKLYGADFEQMLLEDICDTESD